MDTEYLYSVRRWQTALATLAMIGGCDHSISHSRGSGRSYAPDVVKHRIERKKKLKLRKAAQRRNRG